MANDDLVSICITAYNAKNTIERAINSALKQTYFKKEIIVYDDLSTDGTIDLIANKQKKYGIKVIYGDKNKGVAYARNQLIISAKGKYIAFFDDDDESCDFRVSTQLKNLKNISSHFSGKKIISIAARKQIFPNGRSYVEPAAKPGNLATPDEIIKKALIGTHIKGFYGSCATCSMMGEREFFLEVNLFDESFRRQEDTDFLIRFAQKGGFLYGDPSVLVYQKIAERCYKSKRVELESNRALVKKYSETLSRLGWLKFVFLYQNIKENFFMNKKVDFIIGLITLFFLYPLKSLIKVHAIFFNYKISRARINYIRQFYHD